jgi:CHASE3 domain sensor protein
MGMIPAIFFIVALICVNFGLYFFNRASMFESQEAKLEVEIVDKKMNGLWQLVQQADLGIRGYLLLPDKKMLDPFNSAINQYPNGFDELERLLKKQGFDLSLITDYKKQYIAKMDEALLMKKYQDEGKGEESIAILQKDNGFLLWQKYEAFKTKVMVFEKNLHDQAEARYQESLFNTLVLQISLFFLSFPVLSLVIIRLRRNDRQKRELFNHLKVSNQQYVFRENDQPVKELNDQKIIAELIANLKKASDFIKNITKGNYEVQWEGINPSNQHLNTDNLAGELIQMREQMKKVKEEDRKRLWANEGFAKFADLLRIQDNLFEEKIHQFLSELINYAGANQGALFVLNEDDSKEPVLEMKTCYAYGRHKHLKKTIYRGEGLVGQAFQENDVIFLTDIPEDYITITSGLGQALPSSVLIVPLVNNEQTVGVLELASFHVFEEFEINFIKKLLESLAATLVSANINYQTKLLLEESQQKAEEMRAQEEEMRQNMEELSATQEEMHRKEKEYLDMIETLRSQQSE